MAVVHLMIARLGQSRGEDKNLPHPVAGEPLAGLLPVFDGPNIDFTAEFTATMACPGLGSRGAPEEFHEDWDHQLAVFIVVHFDHSDVARGEWRNFTFLVWLSIVEGRVEE